MVMAVAVPVGIDFLDPRLHAPDQLESLLGFPATAWLMEKADAGSDFEREQVLRFANRIVQDRQSNHSRIFVFTSVKSRGGTSTIVLETARALGSLGVSALAFEANGYSSDPRYSSSKSLGVAAILAGDRQLHSEIILSDELLPDRIPVGNLSQGTNLPAIRSLGNHLLNAASGYDVVLVDAPPILVSGDARSCQSGSPWPALENLARRSAAVGKVLVQRLPVYPSYALAPERWLEPGIATRVRRAIDADGLARDDDWSPGLTAAPQVRTALLNGLDPAITDAIGRARDGARLDEPAIVRLFGARDVDYDSVTRAADDLRRAVSGDTVRYVVNRNINYTNICYYRCKFCAFSKGKTHEALRGAPYDLALDEIVRRSEEAWARGATEVCLQGGIHPDLYRRDLPRVSAAPSKWR